ncbi:hypothetical protein RclHR1_11580009 [Rhizophagus clarus]|uniref:NADPH-dependent FMN reductase-like domain-containing protein n=1 Tax=Rhizophagus clarus TaxID=94130 RepID=A0A2Z6QWE9_9GLOM|nr:hypothetical protein RclHR1_11580009 [Rhizophagus clarus]
MSTFKIAGICGSLRKESYNKKLILRAQKLCAEHVKGATINIIDWSKLPVYNQDDEVDPPQSVLDFRKELADHDAILIATPEYNWSIPGPLKNALDWAEGAGITFNVTTGEKEPRPIGDRGQVFAGKAVAIIGASIGSAPGSPGSGRAQLALRQALIFLDMIAVNQPSVTISDASNAFKDDGSLTNERFEINIIKVLQNLVKLGKQLKTKPE